MDFDLDFLKTNLIFMQKSLKNMDKNSHEYRAITNIIKDEIIDKTREALQKDKKAQEAIEKIKENNKTYFDKYTYPDFQEYYCDEDDIGPRGNSALYDYEIDMRYSSSLYDDYCAYIYDFDKIITKLESKKELIQKEPVKKLFFVRKKAELAKMEKMKEVDQEIESAYNKRAHWLKVKKQEELFNKHWFKDGEFVNINEEYEMKLKKLGKLYFHKVVAKCLRNNPELVFCKVDKLPIDSNKSWCPVQNAYDQTTAYKDMPDMIKEIIKDEQMALINKAYSASATSKTSQNTKVTTKKTSKASKEKTLEID